MISLSEARACIASTALPLAAERVPLSAARGRVLREDLRAPHDLPAFDRSAMDGYAVGLGDLSEKFRVIGEMQPGTPAEIEIGAGECVRIFTGGAIPRGASQVLMQEDVKREGEWMKPRARGSQTHIRRRGEDVRAGDLVLRAGTRLGAAELSLMAHLGHVLPFVSPAPRVLHLATGRELVDPAATPGAGEIRDSNSTLIAALLEESGARLADQSRCGDEPGAIVRAIEALEGDLTPPTPEGSQPVAGGARSPTPGFTHNESREAGGIAEPPATPWDLLLISGGASVGDYDFGPASLRQLGFTIHFSKINLRPGKPLVFASRGAQLAFVIPGNPVSHFVLYHTAIRAALAAVEGAEPAWRMLHLPLAEAIDEPANPRETWWPARLLAAKGKVQPLRWQSSGDLTGLAGADLLMQIPPATNPLAAGALVACILLS